MFTKKLSLFVIVWFLKFWLGLYRVDLFLCLHEKKNIYVIKRLLNRFLFKIIKTICKADNILK